MTKQRTTHTLLAVLVALLGLHLALRLSPPKAVAQDEPQVWPPPPVEVVQISGASGSRLYRLWSDGTIEFNEQQCAQRPGNWCGWLAVPDMPRP